MCYPSQGLFAASLIKFYNIVSHTSTLLPFLPPYFLFFFLPLFCQPLTSFPCIPLSNCTVEGNETVQEYNSGNLNQSSLASISIFFTVCKCQDAFIYVYKVLCVCMCVAASTTYVCTHICCSFRSVVYSVELTVKILALGPHCFFTKAWNV